MNKREQAGTQNIISIRGDQLQDIDWLSHFEKNRTLMELRKQDRNAYKFDAKQRKKNQLNFMAADALGDNDAQ